ncbi:MAG: Lar family restriction alleviation protein [Tractidigestivibacter sp.]|jgi:Lar family restriction alleviation protein|uniref:Lar family restriction alleviation protein n=1 Tax=Tractidigestivibacter sp. TaxID=2847320 RepID=UPI003D9437A6
MEQRRNMQKLTMLGDVAKECPFCGSKKIYLVENKADAKSATYYGVTCVDCLARTESCFFERPWEAINAWNGGDEGRYCDRKHHDEQ